ncbi:hypothetical protein L202_05059 [Cryptococcus amylolentus CBS 6039]|uniref:Uncharacterized protein n=1 Tax=Cryptococcus amylolentus CBS 6039 TaxID=1295533 RepID=A0A1E3HQG5_9TREE|nr:hypothetical protein L202_05059 [Cryptococcus amylolentus CBS 6039]ODN77966.1 hypothetical protein L202_05059 [Cryptococcus amylolentus CBS 6039]
MSGDSIPGQQHPLPPPPNHNDSDEEEVLEGIAYQAPPRTASLEPQTPVKNTPRKTYSSAKKSVPAVALTPQRRGRSSAPSSAAKSTTKTAVKAASKAAPSPTPNRKRAAPAEEIDSEARLTRSGAKSAATPTKSKGKKAPSKTPMSTVQRGRNSLAGTPTLASGLRDGLPTPSPALRASTRKRARGEGVSKTLTFGEDVFDDDEDEETKAKKHKTEEYTRERFLQNEKQRKLREARNYQFTGDSNAPRTTRSGRAIRDTRDEVMDVEEEELDEYGGKPQDEEPLAPDAPLIPEFELSTAPLVPTSPPLALSPAPEPENTTGQPLPDDAEPVLKTILNTLNSRGITRDPPSFLDEDKNEALQGIYNLIKGTVDRGEGNSALVVGPRGSGKTRTVARALSLLPSSAARTAPIIVRLSGLAQTTDRLAIREMGRQIAEAEGRVMEEEAVDEDERGEDEEYAPTTLPSHLLALLTAPSPRAIIILIEEFDLFTEHARQALLYCLFDVVQSVRSGPVGTTPRGLAVIGITPRLDTLLLLEKRVKSRFSHRIWRVTSPLASVMQGGVGGVGNGTEGQGRGGWEVLLKMALIPWYPESVMDDPEENEKWRGDWEYVIVTTLGDERIRRYFDRLVGLTTDVRVLYRPFILPITRVITRLDQKLDPKILADQILAQVETASFGLQNNKLRGLPTPCLGILIIAKHLAFAGREEFTYAMVEEEYLRFARTRLVGIGKVRWSVGVLRTAFSHLVRIALLAPTSSSTTVTNKQHPDFLKVRCTLSPNEIVEWFTEAGKDSVGPELGTWGRTLGGHA